MSPQAVGEGFPLSNAVEDIFHGRLNGWLLGKHLTNGQASIERQSGIDKSGQFLSKKHDLFGADFPKSPAKIKSPGLAGLSRPDQYGYQAHVLELHSNRRLICAVHVSIHQTTAFGYCFVEECRHSSKLVRCQVWVVRGLSC